MTAIDRTRGGPNTANGSAQSAVEALHNLDKLMPSFSSLPIGFLSVEPQVYTARGWRPVRVFQRQPFVLLDGQPWTLTTHDVRTLHEDGLIRHVKRPDYHLLGHVHPKRLPDPVWLATVADSRQQTFAALAVDDTTGNLRLSAYVEGEDTAQIISACLEQIQIIRQMLCRTTSSETQKPKR